MGRVTGKKAFITGGAQGLGAAISRMLAKEGAKVTVTDINGPGAEETAAAINAEFGAGTAFAFHHDVTDEARWQEVLQAGHDAMGGLNILVNNAGIGTIGSVEDETYDAFRKVQAVDVDSIFLGCKYAMPLMRDHGLGSIVNISSIAGIIASHNYVSYKRPRRLCAICPNQLRCTGPRPAARSGVIRSIRLLSIRRYLMGSKRCLGKKRAWPSWPGKCRSAEWASRTTSLMRFCIWPLMRVNL